jgi:hypothetical protein
MAKDQLRQTLRTNKKSKKKTWTVQKWSFSNILIRMMRISFLLTAYQVPVPTNSLELVCLNVGISAYFYWRCSVIPFGAAKYETKKMEYSKMAGVLRL